MHLYRLKILIGTWLTYLFLVALGLIAVFPFIWMISTGFKSFEEATSLSLQVFPSELLWKNWLYVFQHAPFGRYFFNTFFVAGVVTLLVCFSSLCAGYVFAKIHFPFKNFLFAITMATVMIPFEAVLIPDFILITRLGWYNTYLGLIFPWGANAFYILLLRQSFLTIPVEYYESAQIDGCGHFSFLWYLAIPFVKPSLLTVGLFAFLGSYNSLLWPLVVTADETKRLIQVGLMVFSGDAGVRVHLLMCASTLVAIPPIILFLIMQRYFFQESIRIGLKG